jgi:hypothetical protein
MLSNATRRFVLKEIAMLRGDSPMGARRNGWSPDHASAGRFEPVFVEVSVGG